MWTAGIFVALAIFSLSSVVLLGFAMLPTVVACIVDRTPQKNATFCVGGMNLSGTFASLMDLWTGAHDVNHALAILGDVFALAIIYGAAAFGWLLYMLIPPVVTTFLSMMAKHRVGQLRTLQSQLRDEWGDVLARAAGGSGVAATPSPPPQRG